MIAMSDGDRRRTAGRDRTAAAGRTGALGGTPTATGLVTERLGLPSAMNPITVLRQLAGGVMVGLGLERLYHDEEQDPMPRIVTRDHFELAYEPGSGVLRQEEINPMRSAVEAVQDAGTVRLADGRSEREYGLRGPIPGWATDEAPDDLLVMVHGWGAGSEAALGRLALFRDSARDAGFDGDVVGFSWDADQSPVEWRHGVTVAARNGVKLGQALHDYGVDHPGTRLHVVGMSLGSEVVLEAIRALHAAGLEDAVATAHLLGGASPSGSVATHGRYGDAIADAAGAVHNYWTPLDATVNGLYRVAEDGSGLGGSGSRGPTPPNYHDHEVEVTDHFSYYLPGSGCLDAVIESIRGA